MESDPLDSDPSVEQFAQPADFAGVLRDPVAESRARHQNMVSDSTTLAGLAREVMRVQLAADKRVSDAVDAERKRKEKDISDLKADYEAVKAELNLLRNELSTTALQVHQAARSEALALARFPAQVASEGMKLLEDMRKPPPPGTNGFDVMQRLGGEALAHFSRLAEKVIDANPEVPKKLRALVADAVPAATVQQEAAPTAAPETAQLPVPAAEVPAGFADVKVFQVLDLLGKVSDEDQGRFFGGLGLKNIGQATCRDLLLFWFEFYPKQNTEASAGAA